MNHTRFPKEDRLPDWARQDNKDTKGDRAYYDRYTNGDVQYEIPSLMIDVTTLSRPCLTEVW